MMEDGGDVATYVRAADRLRIRRQERGWSLARLGKEAKLNVNTVRTAESGDRDCNSSTYQKLALALGLDLSTLFGDGPRGEERDVVEEQRQTLAAMHRQLKEMEKLLLESQRRLPPTHVRPRS